jgi:hypothetical protein
MLAGGVEEPLDACVPLGAVHGAEATGEFDLGLGGPQRLLGEVIGKGDRLLEGKSEYGRLVLVEAAHKVVGLAGFGRSFFARGFGFGGWLFLASTLENGGITCFHGGVFCQGQAGGALLATLVSDDLLLSPTTASASFSPS